VRDQAGFHPGIQDEMQARIQVRNQARIQV
jgi:hypothetical protein